MPGVVKLNPDSILYDETGHAIAVILDGTTYRLAVDANLSKWLGSTAPTVGQKTMVNSVPVTIASNQSNLPVNIYDSGGNVIDSAHPLVVQTIAAPSTALQDMAIGKVLMGGTAQRYKWPCYRTTYTEQTTGAQRSLASSSAADTSAGTGARQVKITYMTSDLTQRKTETVTLSGTTGVNTTNNDICFIEKMEVVSVGSGGTNAGTISIYTQTAKGGSVFGSIALATDGTANTCAIDKRTYWAHHYVLTGKICNIQSYYGGTQNNNNAEVFLSTRNPLVSTSPDVQISDSLTTGLNSPTIARMVQNTIKVIGPAKVTLMMVPEGNNTSYYGSFDFWET